MMFHIRVSARLTRQLLAALSLFCLSLGAVQADEAREFAGADLRLIGGDFGAGKGLIAGIDMTLPEGTHTYWRKPGDSGIAPRFDWAGSDNLAKAEILWPAPQRFDLPDDMTVGYTEHVVWPVRVTAKDPARPVTLQLHMDFGVCSDICAPGRADFTLTLKSKMPSEDATLIQSFLDRVPRAPHAGERVSARLRDSEMTVLVAGVAGQPSLILEGPKGVWFGKPKTTELKKSKDAVAGVRYTVPVEMRAGSRLKGQDVTLTFSSPKTAIEAKIQVK